MQDLIEKIQSLKSNLEKTGELLNLEQKKQKILELEDEMQEPNFWQDQERAKKISQELAGLKDEIEEYEKLVKEINDLLEMAKELEKEEDFKDLPKGSKKSLPEGSKKGEKGGVNLEKDIQTGLEKINKDFEKLEFKIMLSGKHDENNAILAIHAGTGGIDAQNWAEMLERMFFRYCERKKFKVNILDRQVGSEAGLKSVVFEVMGKYAYGYLKSESGVHRLVRISPYDAEKMRHTSFALVEALPELEEVPEIELKDDDLIIETFRSSGHGGQSVNKTDSAVRIRHKPTGIMVTCQNERSQLQNKQTALKILKSRLKQYNESEQEEERKRLRGEFSEAAWGNQIRSYVLQPYKLVKDHRTDYETQAVESVLDGELDEFVQEYLRRKVGNKE